MSSLRSVRSLVALAAVVASCSAFAVQGRLGFSVAVETDGFFSSTLKQVKITAVTAGAPAEQAGLRVGDSVESINDVAIVGASGTKIMDIVHAVQPGEHLRMKVLRDGAGRVVDIVGGAPQ